MRDGLLAPQPQLNSMNQTQRLLRRLPVGNSTHTFAFNELPDNVKVELTRSLLHRRAAHNERETAEAGCLAAGGSASSATAPTGATGKGVTEELVSLSTPALGLNYKTIATSQMILDKRMTQQGGGGLPVATTVHKSFPPTPPADEEWSAEEKVLASGEESIVLLPRGEDGATTSMSVHYPVSTSEECLPTLATVCSASRADYLELPCVYVLGIPLPLLPADGLSCATAFIQDRLLFDVPSAQLILLRPRKKGAESSLEAAVFLAQQYTFEALRAHRASAVALTGSTPYRLLYLMVRPPLTQAFAHAKYAVDPTKAPLWTASLLYPTCFRSSTAVVRTTQVLQDEAAAAPVSGDPQDTCPWVPMHNKRLRQRAGHEGLWGTQISRNRLPLAYRERGEANMKDEHTEPSAATRLLVAGGGPRNLYSVTCSDSQKSIFKGLRQYRDVLQQQQLEREAGVAGPLHPPEPLLSPEEGSESVECRLEDRQRSRRYEHFAVEVVESVTVEALAGAPSPSCRTPLVQAIWAILRSSGEASPVLPVAAEVLATVRTRILLPWLRSTTPSRCAQTPATGDSGSARGGGGFLWNVPKIAAHCRWSELFADRFGHFDRILPPDLYTKVTLEVPTAAVHGGRGITEGILLRDSGWLHAVLLPAFRQYADMHYAVDASSGLYRRRSVAGDPSAGGPKEGRDDAVMDVSIAAHHYAATQKLARTGAVRLRRRRVGVVPVLPFLRWATDAPTGTLLPAEHLRFLRYCLASEDDFDVLSGDRTTVAFFEDDGISDTAAVDGA